MSHAQQLSSALLTLQIADHGMLLVCINTARQVLLGALKHLTLCGRLWQYPDLVTALPQLNSSISELCHAY